MAMNEETAVKLVRYCLDMSAEEDCLAQAGASVHAVGRYLEVLDILLDDIGFPVDETKRADPSDVPRLLFSRQKIHAVFESLPHAAADDAIRCAVRTWREMSGDLSRFYDFY